MASAIFHSCLAWTRWRRLGRGVEGSEGAPEEVELSAAARPWVETEVEWEGGPVAATLDRGRFAQALGNVLANAAEHGVGPVRVISRADGVGPGVAIIRLFPATPQAVQRGCIGIRRAVRYPPIPIRYRQTAPVCAYPVHLSCVVKSPPAQAPRRQRARAARLAWPAIADRRLHARGPPHLSAAERGHPLGVQPVGDRLQRHS